MENYSEENYYFDKVIIKDIETNKVIDTIQNVSYRETHSESEGNNDAFWNINFSEDIQYDKDEVLDMLMEVDNDTMINKKEIVIEVYPFS